MNTNSDGVSGDSLQFSDLGRELGPCRLVVEGEAPSVVTSSELDDERHRLLVGRGFLVQPPSLLFYLFTTRR